MLEIKNLCFSAREQGGAREIIKDVSLSVPDGRTLVLTGPNGGGKTTLAKLIMGLLTPDSGSVLWNGQDVTPLSITERARLGISYGFQQPPRFKGMTVSDLLRIASGHKELTYAQSCEYLTRVGLCARDYVDRDMDASLSGGEAKRIEIATILAKGGGLMIFDEPEAGIDMWSFTRLIDTFATIKKDTGATLIIISHQERIIDLADEIALIDRGEVAASGTADEMLKKLRGTLITGCSVMEAMVK